MQRGTFWIYTGFALIWIVALIAALAYPTAPRREIHYVSTEQSTFSDQQTGQPAPAFTAPSIDGTVYSLPNSDRPVLLLFIKHDCPCSAEAEPFFQRLHTAFGDRVSFLGVLDRDADAGVGREYARANGTPYPLLLDADGAIATAYAVPCSVTSVTITPTGRIGRRFPGYSQTLLAEMTTHLAELAHREIPALDWRDAPVRAITGCPLE